MKNLLVTILSAQPIPNVQFIKYIQEKLKTKNKKFEHIFVSTEEMEAKGIGNWICKVCGISQLQTIVVKHNSLSDIQTKLTEKCPEAETYFVNVTGGTKIMSMGVSDFFKMKANARIYYIDGNKSWLNFPENERYNNDLADNINLMEYTDSHGFEMSEGKLSGIDFEYTKRFLHHFIKFGENERRITNQLRAKRDKTVTINDINGLQDFLCNINFPLSDGNFLTVNKYEIKYLTGDWFEEYIYFRIIDEKIVKNENLKTGVHLKKTGVDNEFDIIFRYNTKFYAIECKTSILSDKGSIVNETIYKSTALQRNLGLFSNFNIFTLSSKESNDVKAIHLNRANDLNIKVFCREDILNCVKISDLLNLKSQ